MITEKINSIREAIYIDLGLMVIDSELLNTNKLPKQYYSYKVININLEDRQQGASKIVDNEDIYEILMLDSKFTVSFTSYSRDLEEARANATALWGWLKFQGRTRLKQDGLDIVVVSVGDIQDRTTTLYDYYDYKYGFDVEFRTLVKLEREIDTIETYEIKGEIKE